MYKPFIRSSKPTLAFTTVQTVLNVLHQKGRVRRKLQGRAYEYRPVESKDLVLGQAIARFGPANVRRIARRSRDEPGENAPNRLGNPGSPEQAARDGERRGNGMSDLLLSLTSYVVNAMWQLPLVFAAGWCLSQW